MPRVAHPPKLRLFLPILAISAMLWSSELARLVVVFPSQIQLPPLALLATTQCGWTRRHQTDNRSELDSATYWPLPKNAEDCSTTPALRVGEEARQLNHVTFPDMSAPTLLHSLPRPTQFGEFPANQSWLLGEIAEIAETHIPTVSEAGIVRTKGKLKNSAGIRPPTDTQPLMFGTSWERVRPESGRTHNDSQSILNFGNA